MFIISISAKQAATIKIGRACKLIVYYIHFFLVYKLYYLYIWLLKTFSRVWYLSIFVAMVSGRARGFPGLSLLIIKIKLIRYINYERFLTLFQPLHYIKCGYSTFSINEEHVMSRCRTYPWMIFLRFDHLIIYILYWSLFNSLFSLSIMCSDTVFSK